MMRLTFTKNINVLSLFDGMSCGRVALERAGLTVNNYYSSEIDKFAIQVADNNYPDNIKLGDVTQWKNWSIDWSSIDLIIAGSPCQGFSFAGKQFGFDDPRSKLFFVFIEILNHIKSVNSQVSFLLENVRMKKEFQDIITKYLSVEPILINSALVSAQNRNRLYWCNWSVSQPSDKNILLKDMCKSSFTLINQRMNKIYGNLAKHKAFHDNVRYFNEKHKTLLAEGVQPANSGGCNIKLNNDWYQVTPLGAERLQTLPDNYTQGVSDSQRYKMLGNGWTVDVIAHIFKQNKDFHPCGFVMKST